MLIHAHTNRIGRARFGIVSAVDHENGLIKIRLQPENTETGWICDAALSVGTVTIYAPSEVGAHVFVDTPHGDGDNYVVVSRIFDSSSLPESFSCLDGQKVSVGQMGIKAGNVELVVDESGLNIVSDIKISGNVTITGEVSVSGDVKASDISLVNHVHGGVKSGADETGSPQ
nr:phage baseplate assembly protein V [Acetobacter conturbans]